MATVFDPYEAWLGVSRQPLHPDRYRLLGLPPFIADEAAIRQAAAGRKALVEPHAAGPHAAAAQRLLEELALAAACLLDAGKKASYDGLLRQQLTARGETNGGASPVATATAGDPQSVDPDIDDLLPPVAGSPSPPAAIPVAMPAIPSAVPVAMVAGPQAIPVAVPAIPMAVAAAGFAPSSDSPVWAGPGAASTVGMLPSAPTVSRTAHRKRSLTPLLLAIVAPLALVGVFGLGAFLLNESGPSPADDSAGTQVASASPHDRGQEVASPRWRETSSTQSGDGRRSPPMSLAEAASRPEETPDGEMPDEMPEETSEDSDAGMPAEGMPAEAMPDENPPDETPEPNPEPEPEPAAVNVADALMAARQALSQRKLATAKRQIDAAATLATTDEERVEVERLSAMYVYVEGFWNAVDEALKSLDSGLDFAYNDTRIGVVEKSDNRLVLRMEGENKEYQLDDLPTKLAVALSEHWFDKQDPRYLLSIGAYLAVHPKGDRDKAEALWLQAKLNGLADEADLVMPELAVKITETGSDEPARVAEVATGDKRLKEPTEVERAAALEQVRTLYSDDYGAAIDTATRLLLAEKLLATGFDSAGDPTLRYVLLVEARDLGAAAGDANTIARAVDALSEFYAVDRWEQTAKAITEGAKTAPPEACEALAQAGLDMADEAVLTEEFGGALALVRAAQAAARKSDNRDLVKDAAARFKEIQAARRGA